MPGAGGPSFQMALLAWSAEARRNLPWRRTRDPWAVLVSELMLQQTQVARVVPRYEAFVRRFPTVTDCAHASSGDVVAMWAGLGYNRRAVNLHRAATTIVQCHGARVPNNLEQLLALPGVGPYTARAVMAFAFEADVGLVETNSARVLARAVNGTPMTPGAAQALADRMVPPTKGWAWNQAVFDLGATVCTRQRPNCDRCPVIGYCAWSRAGRAAPDPAGARRAQSSFDGSDRQGRGRLVAALRAGPVAPAGLAAATGWPDDPERARAVAATLVAEELAVRDDDDRLRLPR